MSKHPITVALENLDLDALSGALDPEVVFNSPVLATTGDELKGRDLVVQILATAIKGFGPPQNVVEYQAPDGRYIVAFDGEMEGNRLNVQMRVTEGPDGKVIDLAPHMRPYPIVTLFREHMMAHLMPEPVPAELWALPAAEYRKNKPPFP